LFFIATLSFALKASSFEDTGNFYRDEISPVVEANSCGALCISSPDYYQGYLIQQERNDRLYAPESSKAAVTEEKMNALNYRRYKGKDYIQGLGWGPDSDVSRFVVRRKIAFARVLRDTGFQVAENQRSLGSAFWREVRKPVLFKLRNMVTEPYRKKKLSAGERARLWILEQTVDAGASTLELDSFGGSGGQSISADFAIKDLIIRYSPRVDPVTGRYGVRLKARKYIRKQRPINFSFSANYCNSSRGFGNRICRYQHELSTSFSFLNPTRKWACSAYLSYQTDSLDPDAYIVDGVPYEHKPWITGVNITYAFY
jgi:hypothetical protein